MFETADNWVDLREPAQRESLARRIGRAPAGPADVEITLDGRERPLWCAVSDVAADLRPAASVVEAFRALPPDAALAAWKEIARGVHDVDVDRAKELKFEGDGGVRKWNVDFRRRYADLMAELSLALGDAGLRAADELGREQAKTKWMIGAASSQRGRSRATRKPIPEEWYELIEKVFPGDHLTANPWVQKQLLEVLPEPRAAKLPDQVWQG